ncbi:MAG: HEAT repeat domain-containing protein [Planctomycetota bacterium]|nr:HEAT repeat domain-containing protein [Planctomycetota bacterium]
MQSILMMGFLITLVTCSKKTPPTTDAVPQESQPPKQAPAEPEPLYSGQPASYWINQSRDLAPGTRMGAVQALVTLGIEVPGVAQALEEAIDDEKSTTKIRIKAVLALASAKPDKALEVLAEAVKDEEPAIAAQAMNALGDLDGAIAIPVYLEVLTNEWPDPRQTVRFHKQAVEALTQAGPSAKDGAENLSRLLGSEDRQLRAAVCKALAAISEASQPIAEKLAGVAIGDESEEVRNEAWAALKRIGPDGAVSALVSPFSAPEEDLKPDHEVLRRAAGYLAEVGPPADDAVSLLHEYLRRPLSSDGRAQPDETIDAILAAVRSIRKNSIGEKLVPDLIGDLESGDRLRQLNAVHLLTRVGSEAEAAAPALAVAYLKGVGPFRDRCAEALQTMEPETLQSAFRAILASADPDLQMEAALAVPDADPEASVPLLVQALEAQDPRLQHRALDALGRVRSSAGPAVPALIPLLGTADWRMRQSVPNTLANIVRGDPGTLPVLLKALEEEDVAIRVRIIDVIVMLGEAAKGALPSLTTALEDSEVGVRAAAATALGSLGPVAGGSASALIKALEDEEWTVQRAAMDALAKLGPDAIPPLLEALESQNRRKKWGAIMVFQEMGPEAKLAAPALAQIWLYDEDRDLKRAAGTAVGRIGAEHALSVLLEALPGDQDGVLAKYVGGIGEPAIEPLREMLESDDAASRDAAAAALGAMGRGARVAGSDILRLWLQHRSQNAAKAIHEIRMPHDDAVPILSEALKADQPHVQAAAATALGWFPDAKAQSLPLLTESLKNPHLTVKLESAGAIWKLTNDARYPLPVIQQALRDGDVTLANRAGQIVQWMGSEASECVPALMDLVMDWRAQREAAFTALDALYKIGPGAKSVEGDLELLFRKVRMGDGEFGQKIMRTKRAIQGRRR